MQDEKPIYGIRSFPEYEDLSNCINSYTDLVAEDYWISAIIIQEIFDPKYTGVIQQMSEGFIIEITRGHFLTKGIVPTSQYIVSKEGNVLERIEVHQETWLKIIEGHVVYCVCNNEEDTLVTISDNVIKFMLEYFSSVLKKETNIVEFGLLEKSDGIFQPYLIDFVDDNSPINISNKDIMSGIVSYGTVTGKIIIIENEEKDSLNEHFHNNIEKIQKSNDKVVFFCKSPELALLKLLEQYKSENIGFVFENCALGAHLAVVLREKRIPAIKLEKIYWRFPKDGVCFLDAQTPDLEPQERFKYE